MKPTFEKTVDILVKAYLNGTLEHGNCAACAVGNIIAASIGANVVAREYSWLRNGAHISPIWDEVFCSSGAGKQVVLPEEYKGWVKKQIDTSGYSWQELALIERTFETHSPFEDENYRDGADDADRDIEEKSMFNGLMAVVDVLAEIHGIDLKVREDAKSLFVKV